MRTLVCLLAFWISAPASAEVMTGPVTVSDGDTLSMTGTRIRLFGIDAPENAQTCQRAGETWECGKEAAARLASFLDGKEVQCERRDTDGYGRMVAVCRAGGLDLGEVMVGSGLAVALPKFSDAYVETEARARRGKLGLWGSVFETPAAYRAAQPAAPQAVRRTPPRPSAQRGSSAQRNGVGCVIKGNRNRKGQWIYHLPGMPYYDPTRAEEMFCTEEQAVAAGYRRAIVRQ